MGKRILFIWNKTKIIWFVCSGWWIKLGLNTDLLEGSFWLERPQIPGSGKGRVLGGGRLGEHFWVPLPHSPLRGSSPRRVGVYPGHGSPWGPSGATHLTEGLHHAHEGERVGWWHPGPGIRNRYQSYDWKHGIAAPKEILPGSSNSTSMASVLPFHLKFQRTLTSGGILKQV